MMSSKTPDVDDIAEKVLKGSISPAALSESVRRLMISGRYRAALDMYENLLDCDSEEGGGLSPGFLNDSTLMMLVQCYSRMGKPAPFLQLCRSLHDKRKYTPLFVERMVINFADLDRLDVVEALLQEWLGRNLKSSGNGDADAVGATTGGDDGKTDWNEILRESLQQSSARPTDFSSASDGSGEPNNDLTAVIETDLRAFAAPLLERTSPKTGKRSKRSFLSSTKSAAFTSTLLSNLDVGALSYVLPSMDVWKSVVKMYAHRTAWKQCLQVSSICLSTHSKGLSSSSSSSGKYDAAELAANERALRSVVHHTVRALCRSGQYTEALEYLTETENRVGGNNNKKVLRKASTMALFIPFFSTQGSPAALQMVIDGTLDVVEGYLSQARQDKNNHNSERNQGRGEDLVAETPEVRGLLSELCSMLCRRGYVAEAHLIVERVVEAATATADDYDGDGGDHDGSDGGSRKKAEYLRSAAPAKLLRPGLLAQLVNAYAMRDDDRALQMFRALKYREGPLARAMSSDGFAEAVENAYHALASREKFMEHVTTMGQD
jgi:hypothetical protein